MEMLKAIFYGYVADKATVPNHAYNHSAKGGLHAARDLEQAAVWYILNQYSGVLPQVSDFCHTCGRTRK